MLIDTRVFVLHLLLYFAPLTVHPTSFSQPLPFPHYSFSVTSSIISETLEMVPFNGTIRKADGYDANSYTYYPVAIIGAGASGIAMACRLKEVLGFDQFRVFERQGGIGGTWWINRYPGVAVDMLAAFQPYLISPSF